jgi:predicted metal-dependent HD superfamily phosphohydrolase
MLDDFHDFKKDFPNYTDLWDEIEWAIWFHDIYQTHSGKDEQLSAKLAVSLAESHTNLWVYPVHQIIISTTHCLNPRVGYTSAETLTPEQKIMCDLDLAGFVAPEDVFREAQKRIRAEYPTVGDEDYKENRKLFMGKLLGRGYVFLTEEFEPAEENARKRIEGIIKGEYD